MTNLFTSAILNTKYVESYRFIVECSDGVIRVTHNYSCPENLFAMHQEIITNGGKILRKISETEYQQKQIKN